MICHDLLSLKKPGSTSEGLKLRIGEDIRCTCHVSFFVSGNDHLSNPNKSNKMQKLFGHPSIHPLHLTKKTTTASLRVWQFSKGLYDLQKSKISFHLISLPNPKDSKDQAWTLFLLAVQGYNTIARFHHVGLLPGTNCFRTCIEGLVSKTAKENFQHLRKNETTKNRQKLLNISVMVPINRKFNERLNLT